MALALPTTRCVGVDPAPRLGDQVVPEAEIYLVPSNEFFARYELNSILEGLLPLDLGFIDGLHVFEQVLDDFINVERYCGPNSTILMHDCLPVNELTASKTQQTRFWTGDVWRVLPTLAHFRPDLAVSAVASFPSGLAIIRKLDPESRTLPMRREEAIRFGHSLDFSTLEELPRFGIQVLPSDWNVISRLFVGTAL